MAASKAITVVLIAAMFALAWGQAPAPEPAASTSEPSSGEAPGSSDCITNLLNVSDCLSYVQTGSNVTKPDKACCPELAGLVESSPICLCYLFDKNKTASYGISIDKSRALKLPSVCGVTTPSFSLCSVIAGVPIGSPTGSEGSPGSTPERLAPSPLAGNKAWNHGVSISTLAFLLALAIAFQFPIFPFFGI